MARPTGLIYGVNETPPPTVLGVGAMQHVAVNTAMIFYPVLLATTAGLPTAKLMDMVALSLVALGIGTILMCMNTRWMGSGFLCPAAFSLTYLGPSLYALNIGGLPLVFGMTLVAGALQLLIPSADEIIEAEDGADLLAGYLLRASCDRVQATSKGSRTTLLFHFDH